MFWYGVSIREVVPVRQGVRAKKGLVSIQHRPIGNSIHVSNAKKQIDAACMKQKAGRKSADEKRTYNGSNSIHTCTSIAISG